MSARDVNSAEPPSEPRASRLSRSLSGTNLARAGDYNLRTVLQAVRLAQGTTRAAITAQTGLTTPTIANITGRLIEMGLVEVVGRRQGRRGQPAFELQVVPDGAFAIGLNVDRDHLTLLTLDLAGQVRSRVVREVPFPLPDEVARFFADELDRLLDEGGVKRDRVLGLGIAIPDDLGRIALPHRPQAYDAWNEANLSQLLGDQIRWPVLCDNDAAAAALGEAEYGTAYDNPSFFYLLVSAGLGGGVVIDRSFHRGATSRSGEIGLMPDLTGARTDAVVQDTVSLSALLDRLEAEGFSVNGPDALEALTGDATAIVDRWLADAVLSLVQPMVAINCLLDLDAVLIGGRLPLPIIQRLADGLTEALASLALPSRAKIMPAVIAQDAPAVGAAILPFLDQLLPSDSILIKAGR